MVRTEIDILLYNLASKNSNLKKKIISLLYKMDHMILF